MPLLSNSDLSEDVRQIGVGPEPEEGEQSAPDKHTYILPNHVNSTQGVFSPDDLAVSPYNLWSIWALRYLTIVFTLVTFICVMWALLMGLWTLFTDCMVKWGKAEEEERLTGCAETRRTRFEWFEVMLLTIAYTIILMALFLITLTIILRALDGGKFIFAKLQENLVARSFTRRDAKNSRQIQDKDTPLVVITSGLPVKQSNTWEKKQRDLTELTDKLKGWDIVDSARNGPDHMDY
ncbi:hypothetical protein LZL87_014045 [Fusarium oxysporum]|nr:hypothetical protein LZL87_014045 [Fusarium oxysporum]